MSKKSFDTTWERNIYSLRKQLNVYPYDIVVSLVARLFFKIPKEQRNKIRILDLGCGAGNNSKFLAENGFDVYGIDGSKSAIAVCRSRFKELDLKANFSQGDFFRLPYEENFFDLVIDRESLYSNRWKNIKKTVKEIHRTLNNRGSLINFIYNSDHYDRGLGKAIEPNTYGQFPKESCFYNAGAAHFIDIKEMMELYVNFNVQNVMRHSLHEIYNKPKKLFEYDEYIIIANKKTQSKKYSK